jgi:hypothetical protein
MNLKEPEKSTEQKEKQVFTDEELQKKNTLEKISMISFVSFVILFIIGMNTTQPLIMIIGIIPAIIGFVISLVLKGYKEIQIESLKNYNEKNIDKQLASNNIKATKEIKFKGENEHSITLLLDSHSKKLAFCESKSLFNVPNTYIIEVDNIIDCEILEDNSTIMKGGVGRAVVGGVLAGGVGAIVGSTTRKSSNIVSSLKLRVITNDVTNPMILLNFIVEPIKRDSYIYKTTFEITQEMYALLISVMPKKETKKDDNDVKQKLKDLKSMLDDNLITEEEYNLKKKELLKNM